MSYYYRPIKTFEIKKYNQTKYRWRCRAAKTLIYSDKKQNLEYSLSVSEKDIPTIWMNHFLSVSPRKIKIYVHTKDIYKKTVYSSFISKSLNLEKKSQILTSKLTNSTTEYLAIKRNKL